MASEPDINDYLGLIRQILSNEIEKLVRKIRAINNRAAARGRSGHDIQAVLDAANETLAQGAIKAFRETRRVAAIMSLDRQNIRDITVQELGSFVLAIRSVAEPDQLKRFGNTPGIAQLVDKRIADLESTLRLMTSQMDKGLLNLDTPTDGVLRIDGIPEITQPPQPTGRSQPSGAGYDTGLFAGANPSDVTTPIQSSGAFQSGAFDGDAFDTGESIPSVAIKVEAHAPTIEAGIPLTAGLTTRPTLLRDNVERAELLTRALSLSVAEEIERVKNQRRNDPEAAATIDFLTMISDVLDQIADAIGEARAASSAEKKEEKLTRAETLAESLVESACSYAKRNYERVIDFGGNTAFIVLGTSLFTTLFGVDPNLAFTGALALLAVKK